MLLVTPQAANKTIGQGGFQEIEQMKLFEDMVCYQEEVRDPSRMAEVLNRVIEKAWRGCAPAQINIPRDYWTQVIDIELPQIIRLERPQGGTQAVKDAAKLLSEAEFPRHPERRWCYPVRWHRRLCQAGRSPRRACGLRISAQ